MFQLSDRSGNRPSSWRSPRRSLPVSLRGWQRSVHKNRHQSDKHSLKLLYIRANASLLLADLTSTRDEGRHRRSHVSVREDGQRHQGLHQHTTGLLTHLGGNASVVLTLNDLITCCPVHSFSMVVAWSRWTSGLSRVFLWGRRTRTKACFICGRRSSSYHVLNGTG